MTTPNRADLEPAWLYASFYVCPKCGSLPHVEAVQQVAAQFTEPPSQKAWVNLVRECSERVCMNPGPFPGWSLDPDPLFVQENVPAPSPPQPRRLGCSVFVVALVLLWGWL